MYKHVLNRCRRTAPLLLLALLSTTAISGCGNKGPLYLPEPSDNSSGQNTAPLSAQP